MRHRKNFNHLGRTNSHRKAMLANMATSLILNKRITTTIAKAKALRSFVEPLITKSKDDSTHSRRVVFSYLRDKHGVSELFREIAPKIVDRAGGYTRILKTGTRLGDSADMCIIELVDYNENLLSPKDTKSKSTRRRKRSGSKTNIETVTETEVVEEATVVQDTLEDASKDSAEVKSESENTKTDEAASANKNESDVD